LVGKSGERNTAEIQREHNDRFFFKLVNAFGKWSKNGETVCDLRKPLKLLSREAVQLTTQAKIKASSLTALQHLRSFFLPVKHSI